VVNQGAYDFVQVRVIPVVKVLLVCGGFLLLYTSGARVTGDVFGFVRADVDASAVEPILACVTADVKLGIVVRCLTEAVEFFLRLGGAAVWAHPRVHFFGHLLRDAHTLRVEPVGAQIASNIEFSFIVRGFTDTVQPR